MRSRTHATIAALVVGIALAFGTGAPGCETPVRIPYVQNVQTDSAVIVWKTRDDSTGEVSWGPTTTYGSSAASPRGKRHEVPLTGLLPDTQYFYEVKVDGRVVSGGVPFRTAKTSAQNQFDFIVFGDSGQWTPWMLQIADQLEGQQGVDLIVHTGDVIYPDGDEDKYDLHCFSQYKDFLKSVPMYPCIGNHDDKKRDAEAYLENWSLPLNNLGTERYYSFDWGNVRFISINTEDNYEAGSPQYTFIDNAITTARAAGLDWVIPFFHKPPFSNGRHGDNDTVKRHLVPLFEQHQIKLVFAGHEHNYQRTNEINGVTYIVTGGGGQLLYPVSGGGNIAESKFAWHFVRASVNGTQITFEAINNTGAVIDTHTITK